MTAGVSLDAAAAAQVAAGRPLVSMDQDGLGLPPAQVLAELSALVAAQPLVEDQYGIGGSIEEVEAWFAQTLGKPHALFMPSGTLANQLALRVLAGEDRRIVVQESSHIYNDTGDASQTLSGLTLLPLPGRASFTLDQLRQSAERTASGRVATRIGVVSIESPVRRAYGEQFDWQEVLRICAWSREAGIRTHLDGARLFIASAYTGMAPAEYARPFDTVYVSLWKCFNCLNGAMLAFSDGALVERLRALRRMFGGALFSTWPFALLARSYADGFVERLRAAVTVSEVFMAALAGSALVPSRVERGTNLFRLRLPAAAAAPLRQRLLDQGIVLPRPAALSEREASFLLHVNESWNRMNGHALAKLFRDAAG